MNSAHYALAVQNLWVAIQGLSRKAYVCREINFEVEFGRALAILGESGSGKTSLILALTGLLPSPPFCIERGEIEFAKSTGQSSSALIMQDPSVALNPVLKMSDHFAETLRLQKTKSNSIACELMSLAGILDPEAKLNRYPWQLSGGERQRVVIALALALKPSVIFADEPTSSLDVTVQKRILSLFGTLKQKEKLAIVLITHELGVAAEISDWIAIMYASWFLEYGPKSKVLSNPLHPYTQGLINAFKSLEDPKKLPKSISGAPPNLFELKDLCPFLKRCEMKVDGCLKTPPPKRGGDEHWARCHLV